MTVDVTKLQFYSGHPIDKIVATGTATYTNDGDTTATGTGTGDQFAKIQTDTITNPYGIKCFVRYVWSIDGGASYNAPTAHILYSYTITFTDIPVTSTPVQGLKAAVAVGASASTIYFLTGNGLHGNVSRLSSDPSTSGYTPTSQTFIIKYILFEVS